MTCQLLLLALSGFVLAQCCVAASWQNEWKGPQENNGSKNNATTWICHMNENYGHEGAVNKSQCKASCSSSTDHHQYLGYIGAIVAILFFGSNFVPVKKYKTGDGVFFQWVLCVGIWLVGLVVNFILDSPMFFMPTVIGGFMWTTGNMLAVPIIKMIGLTMGLTVWGVTNMLSGWVVGRFILDQPVACSGLNYGGVATVVVSVIILAFVKSEGKTSIPENEVAGNGVNERSSLLGEKTGSLEGSLSERVLKKSSGKVVSSPNSINTEKVVFRTPAVPGLNDSDDNSWVDKLGVWQKRVLGFVLSLVAGLMFSFLFLPVQFLKLCNDKSHSCTDMDYLFGVYSGILLTSTFYCVLYSVVTRNLPQVYPSAIFPGILSGVMWGIAMAGWFWANQHLSMAISFPLVTAGPGFISSLWGIIVYREIRGWRNIVLFFVAFSVSLTGLVMNGLSRCTVNCNGHTHNNATMFQ